jgi:hypothetical protein
MLAEALASFPDDDDLLYESATLDQLTDDSVSAMRTLAQVLVRDPKHTPAATTRIATWKNT